MLNYVDTVFNTSKSATQNKSIYGYVHVNGCTRTREQYLYIIEYSIRALRADANDNIHYTRHVRVNDSGRWLLETVLIHFIKK